MRLTLIVLSLLLLTAVCAPAPAAAVETDTGRYFGTAGYRIEGNDIYTLSGACPFHSNPQLGGVFPNEQLQEEVGCLSVALGKAESGFLYHVIAVTIADDVTGPNVFAGVCILHESDASWRCDYGADGYADAWEFGCGVGVQANSWGVNGGNDDAMGFAFTVYLDPSTTQVCLATKGGANFVFVE